MRAPSAGDPGETEPRGYGVRENVPNNATLGTVARTQRRSGGRPEVGPAHAELDEEVAERR